MIKQCFTVRALLPAPRSTLLAEFQVQRISSESGIIIPLKFRCKLYTLSTRCKISRAVPSCILGIQSTRNGRLPGCLPCFSRLESHEQQNRQSPDDSGVGAYRGPPGPDSAYPCSKHAYPNPLATTHMTSRPRGRIHGYEAVTMAYLFVKFPGP